VLVKLFAEVFMLTTFRKKKLKTHRLFPSAKRRRR
jgi:hypothetical protein